MHTTNYFNAFIQIAEDCPASSGEMPPVKEGKRSIANMQFDMLYKHPYEYTSDEVLFQVYADRNDLAKTEYAAAKTAFFSKGQPCFRASPLTKRYGWGVHANGDGKIALYGCETSDYKKLTKDKSLELFKAMRTNRKIP